MDLPLVEVRGHALCCQNILTDQVHRWERRSAGARSKGHRLYDWAMHAAGIAAAMPVPCDVKSIRPEP